MEEDNTPAPPASDQQDHNDRLIQLAISLLSLRKAETSNATLPDQLSNSKWDHVFNDSLKRADILLQRLESRDFDIHAYQVFAEGELLTAENIADRFGEIEWDLLVSKAPVIKLLDELRESMQGDISEIENGITRIRNRNLLSAHTDITNTFQRLHESKEVQQAYPQLSGRLNELLAQLVPAKDGVSDHETFVQLKYHQDLFNWCFDEKKTAKGSIIKKYRAHEIFRYAAFKGRALDRLTKTLSALKSGFIPYSEQDLCPDKFLLFEKDGTVF